MRNQAKLDKNLDEDEIETIINKAIIEEIIPNLTIERLTRVLQLITPIGISYKYYMMIKEFNNELQNENKTEASKVLQNIYSQLLSEKTKPLYRSTYSLLYTSFSQLMTTNYIGGR